MKKEEKLTIDCQVVVGSVVCGEVAFKAGQAKYEIECPGAVGRRIKIVQPYNILTLCEVEAYGELTDEKPLRDVARGTIVCKVKKISKTD